VVGELLAPHGAFSASRVRANEARGRVNGVYEIKLVGANRAQLEDGIRRLAEAGFHPLMREEAFRDEDCFTVIVPKEACVGTLIADLADLTIATRMAYETGGGFPGAGFDKARLVVNGAVEDALKMAPKLFRVEAGLITVAPVRRNGTSGHMNGGGDMVEGSFTTSRFMVMPGRAATRAGTLKMGVLAVGMDRSDTNMGRPLRPFLAEFFSAPENDVRFFSLHRRGFADGAFEVTVPDSPDNRVMKSALAARCAGGLWQPEAGDEVLQYHDTDPPLLLFAVDRVQLVAAVRKFESDYMDVREEVEAELKVTMEHLTAKLSAAVENAAADRAALADGQTQIRQQLMEQALAQTKAMKAQAATAAAHNTQIERTLAALQAQTAEMVKVVG